MQDQTSTAGPATFDAIAYWRQRHRRYPHSLRSVGCRSYRQTANEWYYRRVSEVYGGVLDSLDLATGEKVLDAGAGIGMHVPAFVERHWEVTATDVSPEALAELKKRYPSVTTTVSDLAKLPWPNRSFSLVHCFDVLYHVVDKELWRQAINELCRVSGRYVAIHGPWLDHQAKTLKHVRQDSMAEYLQAFAAAGFTERRVAPTLYAFRFPWYHLRNLWPSAWVMIDRRLAARATTGRQFPGTQGITIFERQA